MLGGSPHSAARLFNPKVLYIPRAFFHFSSTDRSQKAAADERGGVISRAPFLEAEREEEKRSAAATDDEPSMALTVSIVNEDVWAVWLFLVGEALQASRRP